jgi:hypothetical protein
VANGIEPRPARRLMDELASRPRRAMEDREKRLFTRGMRQFTVRLVFRDWCEFNPIPRIHLRQGHPEWRSIPPGSKWVKADSRTQGRRELVCIAKGTQ